MDMYYSNHDRGHEPWENPIETTGRPVDEPPRKHKRKGSGAKVAALCLVCALVGGVVGGGGVAVATGALNGGTSTIYEGTRTPTTVSVANVTGNELLTAPEIYAAYVGSTVGITTEIVTTNGWGQPVSSAAAGSGFVITSDGYILTNYHVIEDANTIKVSFVDGTSYDAELVGGEEENDIAVLKIDATGLTPVIIGDSDNVRVGEQVVAIGNPLGELTYSMTSGIISARDRSITMENGEVMNMLQTDTAINSGNSGGPLFDKYGQVVGIVSAKLSSSSSSEASVEGLGFAIPINDVKDMVTSIMENGYVTGKPNVGVLINAVDESVQRYGVPAGVEIMAILDGSCAQKAGLQVGDIITAVGDTQVSTETQLQSAVKDYKAGASVTFTIYRDGNTSTVNVTLDEDNQERQEAMNQLSEEYNSQQQQSQPQQGGNYYYNFPFGNW